MFSFSFLVITSHFFLPPPLHRVVRYCLTNNKHFTFQADTLPEQLQSQKRIVELMADYMEQNLMEVRLFRKCSKFHSITIFAFKALVIVLTL